MDALGEIPWARLGASAWTFVICSVLMLLVGCWRLSRGDATPSGAILARDEETRQKPLAALFGLAAFCALFTYLFSQPAWLGDAMHTLMESLGADNGGSFQVEQNSIQFSCQLAAQLLTVGALLALNRLLPGMLHTRPDGDDSERLFLNRRGLLRLGGLFAACAALMAVGVLLWTALAGIAASQGQSLPGENQPLVELIAKWHGPSWLLSILFVSVTVGAPLVEELGFRAILYPSLRLSMHRGWAIALTGMLFGLVHGNLAAFIPISMMGAWLCIVRDRHGIGTCILLHAMNNAWTAFWLITAPEVAGKL